MYDTIVHNFHCISNKVGINEIKKILKPLIQISLSLLFSKQNKKLLAEGTG